MSTNPFEDEASVDDEHRSRSVSASAQRLSEENAPITIVARGNEKELAYENEGNERHANFPSAFSYDYMAKRLLEDNFVLTALEFHAELLESGRELRRLRDYFSNPVHFESAASSNRLEFLPSTLRKFEFEIF